MTSGGGHQNTYGWQAGDMHPTGMLSRWKLLKEIIEGNIIVFACICILSSMPTLERPGDFLAILSLISKF